MDEKRVHQRLNVEVQGRLEAVDATSVDVIVTDISLGGVYVRTDASPRLATAISLSLDLDGQTIALPGTVRWSKPDGFGVQFGLLGAKDTHTLSSFLKRHRS